MKNSIVDDMNNAKRAYMTPGMRFIALRTKRHLLIVSGSVGRPSATYMVDPDIEEEQ